MNMDGISQNNTTYEILGSQTEPREILIKEEIKEEFIEIPPENFVELKEEPLCTKEISEAVSHHEVWSQGEVIPGEPVKRNNVGLGGKLIGKVERDGAPNANICTHCQLVPMEHWTGEQRAYAVKAYYLHRQSLVHAQQAYRDNFNTSSNRCFPSHEAIQLWVTNFESSGSTSKTKSGSVKTAHP